MKKKKRLNGSKSLSSFKYKNKNPSSSSPLVANSISSSTSSPSSTTSSFNNLPTFDHNNKNHIYINGSTHLKASSSSSFSSRSSSKPARIRTVLNEKQLQILKSFYNNNPRPDALLKEQLVEMTSLNPRVIRVWFQNKRCKDKKKHMLKSDNGPISIGFPQQFQMTSNNMNHSHQNHLTTFNNNNNNNNSSNYNQSLNQQQDQQQQQNHLIQHHLIYEQHCF